MNGKESGKKEKSPKEELFWCQDHTGRSYTYEKALDLIRRFHGHTAPGLVIGVKMVTLAMKKLPEGAVFDVLCETRSCLPDAAQMLTPCTIGNGWLKIKDLGRFAVNLYDKSHGGGLRVTIDPEKLKAHPEVYNWFYKIKTKEEQDFDLLMGEIREAGEGFLSMARVKIKSKYLIKKSKGDIATCPLCKEAYPKAHGSICLGCKGEAPHEKISSIQNP